MNQTVNLRMGQALLLTPTMKQSLHILQADALELKDLLEKEYDNNPLIELVETESGALAGTPLCVEWLGAQSHTLREDLLFQLNTLKLDGGYLRIGRFMIECIDDKGYLREPIAAIASCLGVPEHAVKKTAGIIQGFEPAGVCARTLRERIYLLLIRQTTRDAIAETIVRTCFDMLARNNLDGIARQTGCTKDAVKKAVHAIRSLNVNIVSGYDAEPVAQVMPEVLVSCCEGKITVELINRLPRAKLADGYAGCAKLAHESAGETLREAYYSAYGLIKGIEKRYETLIKVVNAIVRKQHAFFLRDAPIAPLNYSDIAKEAGLSVSSVCRAVANKYLQYENTTYELRRFFPSALQSGKSSAEAKRHILELLRREDVCRTLSDEQIRVLLEEKGITIARRTVAKYRAQLNYPASSWRKTQ